jgi:hypothetical protein
MMLARGVCYTRKRAGDSTHLNRNENLQEIKCNASLIGFNVRRCHVLHEYRLPRRVQRATDTPIVALLPASGIRH